MKIYSTYVFVIIQNAILYAKRRFNVKPLKTKVSITLDTNIIEELKELADADDRSFSRYIT